MLRLIWTLSIYIRSFMRRFMPTNIALDALRTRRGLKWSVPAMLLSVAYVYVAGFVSVLILQGAPKWLYLVVLICIWNAMKFIMNGITSVALLLRVRATERRDRRAAPPAAHVQPVGV